MSYLERNLHRISIISINYILFLFVNNYIINCFLLYGKICLSSFSYLEIHRFYYLEKNSISNFYKALYQYFFFIGKKRIFFQHGKKEDFFLIWKKMLFIIQYINTYKSRNFFFPIWKIIHTIRLKNWVLGTEEAKITFE